MGKARQVAPADGPLRPLDGAGAVQDACEDDSTPVDSPSMHGGADTSVQLEDAYSLAGIQRKVQEFTESSGHQALLFLLSILAIVLYIISTYMDSPGLDRCQFAISIWFVIEWALQLVAADSKLDYLFSLYGLVDIASALPLIHNIEPDIERALIISLLRFCVILRITRVVLLFQIWAAQDADVYREVVYLCFSILAFVLFATGLLHWLDGEWHIFNGDPNLQLSFHESLYFVIVSISTVGYGDLYPATAAGQLLTCALLAVAITIFPIRAGRLISALSQTTYARASYNAHRRSGHVVVVGDFTGGEIKHLAAELLRPVRVTVGPDGQPIARRRWLAPLYSRAVIGGLLSRLALVLSRFAPSGSDQTSHVRREGSLHLVLLAPGDPTPDLLQLMVTHRHRRRIHYLAGSPLSPGDLQRAAVRRAQACFVMCRDVGRDVHGADGANLLACVAIRQYAKQVPLYLQHASSDVSGRTGRFGATLSICLEEAKMRLLARSVVCPGLLALVSNVSTQDRRVFLSQSAHERMEAPGGPSMDVDTEIERTSTLLQRRLASVQMSAYRLPDHLKHKNSRLGPLRHLSSLFIRHAEPAVSVSDPWQVEYDLGVVNDFYTLALGPAFEGVPFRAAALVAYRAHGVLLLGLQPSGGPARRARDFFPPESLDRPCHSGDLCLCLTLSPRRAEKLNARGWSPAAAAAASPPVEASLAAAAQSLQAELDARGSGGAPPQPAVPVLPFPAGIALPSPAGPALPPPADPHPAVVAPALLPPLGPAPVPPASPMRLPPLEGAVLPALDLAPPPSDARRSPAAPPPETAPEAPEAALAGGGHVLVCGEASPSGLATLVRCLREELAAAGRGAAPIVLAVPRPAAQGAWALLAEGERGGVYRVDGEPYAMATLSKGRARTASAVVVLAERRGRGDLGEAVDTPAILAALEALAARRPAVLVDLVYDSNARFLNGASAGAGDGPGAEEADRHVRLCPAFAAGMVYSHAALHTLLCQAYHQGPACVAFLRYALERPGHLAQARVPPAFVGRPYAELVAALLACTLLTPLGLFRAAGTGGSRLPFCYTNPHPHTRLLAGDSLFLLRSRPAGRLLAPEAAPPADTPVRSPVGHAFDF